MGPSLKIADFLCEPAGQENEDILGYTRHAAWVLDGATALKASALLSASDDVRQYVESVNEAFHELARDSGRSIQEIVRHAIRLVSDRFPVSNLRAYEVPSACLAFVRVAAGCFEYATLGDCKLLLQTRADVQTVTENTSLEQFDRIVMGEIKALHRKGITGLADVYSHTRALIRSHRPLMNTPDGYWVLGFAEEAAQHTDYGSCDVTDVTAALPVSDGFYRLVDLFHLFTSGALVTAAKHKGLKRLLEELRSIEASDPDCIAFPRLKPSDDATAVLLEIAR
jgi:hypothetical protein